MRVETLAGAVGVAGLFVAAMIALRPPSPTGDARHASTPAAFPPRPAPHRLDLASRGGMPAVLGLEPEIARIGRSAPRLEPIRRAFLEASNLTQFAMDLLPRAAAGDGASQYFIYLALEQCRAYLRRDMESARLTLETMLHEPEDLVGEEREAWRTDYARCRGFGQGGWDDLGIALGANEPGSEAEYASLWFERAGRAGYPTALAELALRPSPLGGDERRALLREALARGGPDVYWLLFAHSGDIPSGEVSAQALAWLLVACRAGQDCTEQARWYRAFACMRDGGCAGGITALEHYWRAASPAQRDEAWTRARGIEAGLSSGEWAGLPVPDLDRLDNRGYSGGQ